MKRLTVNLLGLAAVLLCTGLDALAQPYRHPATDLVFPEQLAGLERGDVTDYETKSPGLGVSVGYNVPGITVTIYLYTMGMKAVPDDLTSQPLKRHFAGVVSDVFRAGESGAYANVKKTAEAVRVKLLRALDEMTGKPSREPPRGEATVAHAPSRQ